jgi:ectoine hydroxylase-related dioxygenase (phytanoyl-CoA dioxygenase family)
LLSDPAALREQAREDGYLYLRNFLPREKLLDLRRQMLELAREAGWLHADRPLMDGIANPGTFVMEFSAARPEWRVFYRKLQSLRDFQALAHSPKILRVFEAIFGEAVLVQPRNMSRLMFPGDTTYTTPPHQDHIHIRGTPETWTCWFPVGDCPTKLGGLAVLPGSHKVGLMKTKPMPGAGGTGVEIAEDAVWAGGDLQMGDVIMFHSLTVHQGRDNQTADQVRLSCDYRYQPVSQPVDADSLEPHGAVVDWAEVYAGWPKAGPEGDPIQYYWKKHELKITHGKGKY